MNLMQRLTHRWSALKVGWQLALAFSGVLVLTATLGGVSVLALTRVSQASSDLAVKWMPGVGHMAAARAAMLETREFEIKVAHAADASYLAEYEDKMKAAQAVVAKRLSDHMQLAHNTDEAAHIDALKKAWNEYLAWVPRCCPWPRLATPTTPETSARAPAR